MSNNLTQNEIEKLLNMLKYSLESEIMFPITQGKRTKFEVIGDEKQNKFSIIIFRGRIHKIKYNIVAQIYNGNILLMELHIGSDLVHTNPDGEKIIGNHWHIFSEKYGRAYAFSAENIDSEKFVENTILFLDKFNVIQKPQVYYQEELF